jgi:hypothetical protein
MVPYLAEEQTKDSGNHFARDMSKGVVLVKGMSYVKIYANKQAPQRLQQ